ncbi:YbaK/EbsC family protein [Celerinatantimonas diazotrophica]|uniref:Ala-tRNA(Pro) hydrolase n=1 Tax=Celerinatantimonas diazotrophica TaxID=412034 RepID=A0A4R1J8Q8_9GAMM|nr:YbaK/EbsC family protein [Celerinatantimonas diazotrophica]TCK46946.1 Ala-tRNA(Pro) hydrolase [Celerinatantimonas diazotrophica]CAG9295714.1 Prolyl-tRNA editing protein ProX [Celerinatantimonas diazotrophica]
MNQYDPFLEKRQCIAGALATLNISYQCYQHPPLANCHQADELSLVREGTRIKTLFLQDNPGKRHFLLVVPGHIHVDLKQLAKNNLTKRLGFASARRLHKYLNLTPGSVSPLGVIFDKDQKVELWIEQNLWQDAKALQCHPGDNRQTWVIDKNDLERFFHWSDHEFKLVSLNE